MTDLKVLIHNKEVFEQLEPTLLSWLHVITEYTCRVPKNRKNPKDLDYSYWHGERPQLGFLSIAAWQNGWAVLQEWGTSKKNSLGRNDLWIGRGESQLFIEAKSGWCHIERGEQKIEDDIKNHLDHAKESARNMPAPSHHSVAAAFISPLFTGEDKAQFKTAQQQWIKLISKAADAVATITHDFVESPVDKENNHCVGSALLLALV